MNAGTKNLVNAINKLNRGMDMIGIIGEFELQIKVRQVKDQTMMSSTLIVFAMMKEGSPYVHLVHSAAQFGGDPFCPAEYQN